VTLGSLFDGSGTAPLCATILGWNPLWASEIEPYPIAVTTARFPKMQHLGSITEINGAEVAPVDVIVGGSPCQDLSVAGKQAGLTEGTRSNLFYEMTRIIREMRGATNGKYPRFVVWENVPGAFSSNKGRDFHAVVQAFCALADDSVHIPRPAEDTKTGRLTWKTAGAIVGDGWSFAWRVLDAQFWGVPQRRRRIFAVLDFGSERAGEILFERTGLPWNSEPRGETGEGAPADAVGCADRGGGVVGAFCTGAAPAAGSIGYSERVAPTLKAGQCAFPMGAVVYEPMSLKEENWAEADAKNALRAGASKSSHAVVYALQGNGIDRSLTAGCNGAGWREGEMYTLNTIDRPSVVYSIDQQGSKGTANYDENVICTILTSGTPHAVVFDARGNGNGDVAATLTGDHQNRVTDYTNIAVEKRRRYIVRRLTPTECARLQGFPDWWTDGVPGSDTAKYKMWGNGMALPCVLAVLNGINESEKTQQRTCPTCAHHLGGGQCRLNAEAECCEGGGFELWEVRDDG